MSIRVKKRSHKHISVRLAMDDYIRVKKQSEKDGRPLAAQVRHYISKGLDENRQKAEV